MKLKAVSDCYLNLIDPDKYYDVCKKLKCEPILSIDYSEFEVDHNSKLMDCTYLITLNKPVSDNLIKFGPFFLDLKEGDLYFPDRDYGPVPLFPYAAWSKYAFQGYLSKDLFLHTYLKALLKQDFTIFKDLPISEAFSTGSVLYDSLFKYICEMDSEGIQDPINIGVNGRTLDFFDRVLFLFSLIVVSNPRLAFIKVFEGDETSFGVKVDFISSSITDETNSPSRKNNLIASVIGAPIRKQSYSDVELKGIVIEEIMQSTGNSMYEPSKEALAKIGLDKYCTNRELASLARNHTSNYIGFMGVLLSQRTFTAFGDERRFDTGVSGLLNEFDKISKLFLRYSR